MRISEERAGYLMEINKSRRELEQLKLRVMPTESLRILLAAAQGKQKAADRPSPPVIAEGRIPEAVLRDLAASLRTRRPLSTSEIAEAAGYKSPSTFTRQLGVVAEPVRAKNEIAHFNDRIDVESAGRIVRAMGLAPCQIPGL